MDASENLRSERKSCRQQEKPKDEGELLIESDQSCLSFSAFPFHDIPALLPSAALRLRLWERTLMQWVTEE